MAPGSWRDHATSTIMSGHVSLDQRELLPMSLLPAASEQSSFRTPAAQSCRLSVFVTCKTITEPYDMESDNPCALAFPR